MVTSFLNTSFQGTHALTCAVEYFARNNYIVSVPLVDMQPYDLIVENGGTCFKIQVKSTCNLNGSVELRSGGYIKPKKPIDPKLFDFIFIVHYKNNFHDVYLIPSNEIKSFSSLTVSRYKKYKVI